MIGKLSGRCGEREREMRDRGLRVPRITPLVDRVHLSRLTMELDSHIKSSASSFACSTFFYSTATLS